MFHIRKPKPLTLREVQMRDLVRAEDALYTAETEVERWQFEVALQATRIERLTETLGMVDPDEVDDMYVHHINAMETFNANQQTGD